MVIHIDMSGRFYKKENVGIAYLNLNTKEHKGMVLSGRDVKRLIKEVTADEDFARLYAICIYNILKEDISSFKQLVICNDEPFDYVKGYLEILFQDIEHYFSVNVISISDLRILTGNKTLKSRADPLANSYRKRGLKPKHREKRNGKGISLNVVSIKYSEIISYWKLIDMRIK